MKRRELMKMAGIGALSLTGLDRLAKAMAAFDELSKEVAICPDGEGMYLCPRTPTFKCGDNEDAFECEASHFVCGNFVCNPQSGDFNCVADFWGCAGVFRCEGVDPPGNSQFNCRNFAGCIPNVSFWCEDFACNNYT